MYIYIYRYRCIDIFINIYIYIDKTNGMSSKVLMKSMILEVSGEGRAARAPGHLGRAPLP